MIKTQRLTLVPFEDAHFQAVLNKNLVELGLLLNVETPKKLNFTFICRLHDPDDGDIWQWELEKIL